MRAYIPFITIIIPVFNGEGTIQLCLNSVTSLDYPSDCVEIILVDNGSTDATLEIARKYNITILHEPDIKSSYAARNKGILAAKGELIAFTDADCIVTPGWLKHMVTCWDDETFGCFAGEIEAYLPESLVEKFSDREGILRQCNTLESPYLPYPQTANAAYRKSVFDQVGLFVPEMTSGGDADIAWRMQKKLGLKIKYIPEALVYHKHRASIQGLYNQFIKYEYGKFYWTKYYQDYKLAPIEQRQQELVDRIQQHCNALKNNVSCLVNEQIDFVDFVSPYLKMLMCVGTFKARVDIEKSLGRTTELHLACEENSVTVVDLLNTIADKDAVIKDKNAIIKVNAGVIKDKDAMIIDKDKRIKDLHESMSWKITSPLRKLFSLFK